MEINKNGLPLLAFALVGLIASCSKQASEPSAEAPAPAPSQETPAVASTQPDTRPIPPDPAKPDDLKSGIDIMQPFASNAVGGLKPVEVIPSNRYFMHPSMDKDASIEFDTSGLKSLELSPRVGEVGEDSGCAGPGAGIVRFTYSLDNATPVVLTVDRYYVDMIPLDLSTSKRLKLGVNEANGEITCDWFSVGFVNVVAR